MRDPGNLGTMLRTGDAVGAGGLILIDDTVDPFLGGGGAREHGRAVHPADRAGALG
jgi:tRNA G18 (ribose-2'-O)-methylase SpoU